MYVPTGLKTVDGKDIMGFNGAFYLQNKENIIAYDYYGKEIWKINDIVQAKIPRGYDEIEKKLDSILITHYELGIIFEIDVYKIKNKNAFILIEHQ